MNNSFLALKMFYMWKKKTACLSGINEQAKQLLLKVSYSHTHTLFLELHVKLLCVITESENG